MVMGPGSARKISNNCLTEGWDTVQRVHGKTSGICGQECEKSKRRNRMNTKILMTAVVVDLTEQIAGKAALQEAAAQIAERILPKLIVK
jgi:hypothetical protein